MNYNSITNQDIKSKFVGIEVIQCVSYMISEVQEKSDELREEIMDLFYSQLDYDQMFENYIYDLDDEETKELLEEYDVESIDDLDIEQVCNDKNVYYEYCEPYEFWIVSDWLGEKLKEKGCIVEDFLGLTIWGRETSGQAILLDHVISKICEDLEILEGQKNDWSKR